MKLQDILKIKETSECIVHHELTEDWKNCYYQYNSSHFLLMDGVVSKFEEKYNESGWGALDYDHESVFDPTQEVFEDSSLSTVFKRDYTSAEFIKFLKVKIKEYLSLDESKGYEEFDDFINWIGVSGHYAVQDLFEKIGCKKHEITLEQPDDEYLWFSHYEKSGEYDYIWIEEIIGNESINEVKEPFKENDLKSKEGFNKSLEKEDELKLKLVEKYPEIYKDYKEGKFTLELSYKRASHKQNIEKHVKKLNEDIKSGKFKTKNEGDTSQKKFTDTPEGKLILDKAKNIIEDGFGVKLKNENEVDSSQKNNSDTTNRNIKERGYPPGYNEIFEKEGNLTLNEFIAQRVHDSENNISPADRAIIDYKKMEREKKSRNQGGCLVVILFLLSLTLSLII